MNKNQLISLITPICILLGLASLAIIGFIHVTNLKAFNQQQLRDMAVDGCMENARYTWEEKNKQDNTLTNTTDEPNRYWYRLCMQEKGQEVRIDI